ncbi:MAG: molybdopterin-dependent oxidoreductase [Pseudorhodoplanes sp.]|jgi:phenylacetyl-CoA:acceptor oxidoreductase|nr:molybdopterin-dependent oxidoreductase [Pseudorhodoplanes sp.]
MAQAKQSPEKFVSTYCYQCVAGPDLLKVRVENGVATQVVPNFSAAEIHPAGGKACVKAFGLIQKTYNPHRVLQPMKRTNPKKGRGEDPGFVPISWDEALDLVAEKLRAVRAAGLLDEAGYPRVAASFGGGGTPTAYMGTLPAFLAAWGPVDMSFGSGQGVKCYHSEHLYGELWHRAFTVSPDTPLCDYLISFGANVEASGGVCGVKRHADARKRGMKRVQIEPHLSVTGACSAEWVPIKPKTDAAFMFAMIHVVLHEQPRERLDLNFLKHHSSSPYLIGPGGFYLRDPQTRKPLVMDAKSAQPVVFDTPGIEPALEGEFTVDGIEVGPDQEIVTHRGVSVQPAFAHLVTHVGGYSPEWASAICDVPAKTIRRISNEFLDHARVGETIEIEGETLPLRPVAISLGKTVNNGWGGYECCWARTLLACLVGALEVPGGTLGTTVRLNRPADNRWSSVKPGPDGFMEYPMNPTSKEEWVSRPPVRSAHRTLVPLVANSAWSQALGPTHLAWMMQDEDFDKLPHATPPDVWFVYRTNPGISFWDTRAVGQAMARFPFVVCFAYTHDETNHMADVLLPDCTDLEGLQLLRIGGTKYVEQFWDYQGFALRDPVAGAQGEAKDFTWIATELAHRTGLLEAYNGAINRGAAGVKLSGPNFDFSLDPTKVHDVETIWDASCRAASAELTDGEATEGLDYFREKGFRVKPFPRLQWYLYPKLVASGLRFEQPYQERLFRIGKELGRRLHEQGITWWDRQLEEYEPLPHWRDLGGLWEGALARHFKVQIEDFPFWLITARSMQYSWGGNVGIQLIHELAGNVAGHGNVVMNRAAATALGIADGDRVEVRSPLNHTKGRVLLSEGIRPDTILMIGQFDHWATPFAKDFDAPSMNALMPMLLDLTDATGSSADLVKVKVTPLRGAS